MSIDPDVATTDQPYVFTNDNPLNAEDPLGLAEMGIGNGANEFEVPDGYSNSGGGSSEGAGDQGVGGESGDGETNGEVKSNDPTKTDYKISNSESDREHMFRDADGHVMDTPENEALIEDTANDPENYKYTDRGGAKVFEKILENGEKVWAKVWDGQITNGGINAPTR